MKKIFFITAMLISSLCYGEKLSISISYFSDGKLSDWYEVGYAEGDWYLKCSGKIVFFMKDGKCFGKEESRKLYAPIPKKKMLGEIEKVVTTKSIKGVLKMIFVDLDWGSIADKAVPAKMGTFDVSKYIIDNGSESYRIAFSKDPKVGELIRKWKKLPDTYFRRLGEAMIFRQKDFGVFFEFTEIGYNRTIQTAFSNTSDAKCISLDSYTEYKQ